MGWREQRRERSPVVRTRRLLNCGIAAGPLFVGMYSVLGRVTPGYVPRRDPVSSLALGKYRHAQTATFLVAGSLICASAAGTRRALRGQPGGAVLPTLGAAAGLGMIGAGVFVTDPIDPDNPVGPMELSKLTRTGALHVISAVPCFTAPAASCLFSAKRAWSAGDRLWATYSVATAVGSLASASRAGKGFSGDEKYEPDAGLFQRIPVVAGLLWLGLSARRLTRSAETASA